MVDDINDDSELVLVLSVVYQDDAANLDKLGEYLRETRDKCIPCC